MVMDNLIRRLMSPPEKKISKFVHSGIIAADLGCGPGYFTIPMAEMTGPTGKVYAVDSDQRSIQALTTKSESRGLESVIQAHTASAADVSFIPNGFVDFVFANGMLCCMNDHERAVAEIKRILKPSGEAYLSVSRLLRRSDSRSVPKEEWRQILTGFAVKASGEEFLNRWAIVRTLPPQ